MTMRMIELRQMEVSARDAFACVDEQGVYRAASTRWSVSHVLAFFAAALGVAILATNW
jgi:hypothetical protein